MKRALILLALLAATTACQVDVSVKTTIARDGSGDFALSFLVDKELIDLARGTGEDVFASLGEISPDLRAKGWRVTRSNVGGGLSATIERHFTSPEDLNAALAALESEPAGPTRGFFHVTVERSSSFLRNKTSFEGTIDLTTERLLAESDLPESTKNTLRPIVEQAAGEFLKFDVRVTLPGDASRTRGEPSEVRGGTVTWRPSLGKRFTLAASSAAFNPVAFGVIGGPVVILLALAALRFARRRRRAAPTQESPL